MQINSLVYNWTPNPFLDINVIHSAEDNLIPVDCADLLYKVYKEKGCSINYTRTIGDHYQAGTEFTLTAMLYLLVK
jgi:predicted peptidase